MISPASKNAGRQRWLNVLLIGVIVVCGLPCGVLRNYIVTSQRAAQRAAAEEQALTEAHSEEVIRVIENFDMQWNRLAAFQNPEFQQELATAPFYRGEDPTWQERLPPNGIGIDIRKSTNVRQVRVLEYTPERFKALVTVDTVSDIISMPGETVISRDYALVECGLYVFVREDGKWKLAAYFYTDAPSDESIRNTWDNYPLDETKQMIGELPSGDLCEW